MANEDFEFTDNNEIDMDYFDMDSPEPEPRDVDDLKEEDNNVTNNNNNNNNKRSSYTMNNQTQAIIKQFQSSINELQLELRGSQSENENLMVKTETLIIEYDAKIDELNLEIDELQIESQQYQIRYSEINEELHELRSSQADHVSSGKENNELLIRLQNKEQNEISMMIELEQTNKQNQTLKKQIKNANENITKLQHAMIQIKKDKSILDKNMESTMDKYEILHKNSRFEIQNLTARLSQLSRENEIYRQNLSTAEAEKMEMQNNFTEATMELLHDELNDSEVNNYSTDNPMRLERVSTTDMHRRFASINSQNSVDIGGNSHFIKQRFGSQTSLPDQSLLDTFDDQRYHSRKSSLDSRMGSYAGDPANYPPPIDVIKLKQDIKDILVSHLNSLPAPEEGNKFDPKLFRQFEQSINEKIKNILDSRNDMRQFEDIINEKIKNILDSIQVMNESINNKMDEQKQVEDEENEVDKDAERMDKIREILYETIENQMSVFQISLENQIGDTVNENLQHVIEDKINGKLREDIRVDISECVNGIKEEIIQNNNKFSEDNNNNKEKEVVFDEEMLNKKLESAMDKTMDGKIDGFMAEFRKEVIPEFMAIFEQLSTEHKNNNNYNDYDDEKANSGRNELLLMNEKLKKEIEMLQQEKNQHEKILRSAATSKVHQVVKLQNLLDHMRNDNRFLQFQLNKYQQTFARIKENQENNVVNKFWGYFGQNNTSNHLST